MKLKAYQDRKRPIMRSRGNCVDSPKVMEIAFQNIMNEIIEHAIEGICFEAHRAAKRGYFAVGEYILRNLDFDISDHEEVSGPVNNPKADIFGNTESNVQVRSTCPFCKQKKKADVLGRHFISCRSRPPGCNSWDWKENILNNVEEEDNNSDGNDNFDRKKANDAKKQARNARKYDTMTTGEKHDFLKKHCGVISRHTGKPCCNSLSCNKHSVEDKEEVRRFRYGNFPNNVLDGDIDFDTVD